MRHPWLLPAGLAALLLASHDPARCEPESIDQGSYVIYLGDRAIGAETFGITAQSDSVYCMARSFIRRSSDSQKMVEKAMGLSANRTDWSLRYYQSNETSEGQTLIRGVVQDPSDTAMTVFIESPVGGGTANRRVAPPGRMYVLDSGLYTLFDVICLSLYQRTFTARPLTLLMVGPPDSILEAEAKDLGHETIRWGTRSVQARKIQISDGKTTFLAWMSPDRGRMLRLTHEGTGLRVEREPPVVKKGSSGSPKPGG